MDPKPFHPCCTKTAVQAFQQGIFYLIGCEACHTLFSITDDLDLFIQLVIAYYKISPEHPHPFDTILSNGKIVFMLP